MQGEGAVQALRVASDALLPLADPLRQIAVLTAALKTLVDDAAAPHAMARQGDRHSL